MKENEKETQVEEMEELITEAAERPFVSSEEHDKLVTQVDDLKMGIVHLKEKEKHEEQILKCDLKKTEEQCTSSVATIPALQEEEEKFKDIEIKVSFIWDHMKHVKEEVTSFFQEYDTFFNDLIQKFEGQLNELQELINKREEY
jgi:hypothetical protein